MSQELITTQGSDDNLIWKLAKYGLPTAGLLLISYSLYQKITAVESENQTLKKENETLIKQTQELNAKTSSQKELVEELRTLRIAHTILSNNLENKNNKYREETETTQNTIKELSGEISILQESLGEEKKITEKNQDIMSQQRINIETLNLDRKSLQESLSKTEIQLKQEIEAQKNTINELSRKISLLQENLNEEKIITEKNVEKNKFSLIEINDLKEKYNSVKEKSEAEKLVSTVKNEKEKEDLKKAYTLNLELQTKKHHEQIKHSESQIKSLNTKLEELEETKAEFSKQLNFEREENEKLQEELKKEFSTKIQENNKLFLAEKKNLTTQLEELVSKNLELTEHPEQKPYSYKEILDQSSQKILELERQAKVLEEEKIRLIAKNTQLFKKSQTQEEFIQKLNQENLKKEATINHLEEEKARLMRQMEEPQNQIKSFDPLPIWHIEKEKTRIHHSTAPQSPRKIMLNHQKSNAKGIAQMGTFSQSNNSSTINTKSEIHMAQMQNKKKELIAELAEVSKKESTSTHEKEFANYLIFLLALHTRVKTIKEVITEAKQFLVREINIVESEIPKKFSTLATILHSAENIEDDAQENRLPESNKYYFLSEDELVKYHSGFKKGLNELPENPRACNVFGVLLGNYRNAPYGKSSQHPNGMSYSKEDYTTELKNTLFKLMDKSFKQSM